VLKHGVNNFFILADVLLSRQPFVSYHYQAGPPWRPCSNSACPPHMPAMCPDCYRLHHPHLHPPDFSPKEH
jgi:hypothetical protein